MEIKTGIDIIETQRFKKAYKKYKKRFLKKIFLDEEIKNLKENPIKMCISFSFKESIWKALPDKLQKKYNFKSIKIIWDGENPKVTMTIKNYKIFLSYSATKNYVITSVFLLKI